MSRSDLKPREFRSDLGLPSHIDEYWIIDPDAETARQFALEGETCTEAAIAGRGKTLAARFDDKVQIAVDELFAPAESK